MTQASKGALNSDKGQLQNAISIVNVEVHEKATIKLWIRESDKTYISREHKN